MMDDCQSCLPSESDGGCLGKELDDKEEVPGLAHGARINRYSSTNSPRGDVETARCDSAGCVCGDETVKHQLNQLEMHETEADTRLQEVEHRLTMSENKLRTCDDILELVQQLKNRIQLVYEVGAGQDALLGNDAPSASEVHAGPGHLPHMSPIRSPSSPIRTPKSPRAN